MINEWAKDYTDIIARRNLEISELLGIIKILTEKIDDMHYDIEELKNPSEED